MQKPNNNLTSVVLSPELRMEAHRLGINVSAAARDGVERAIERKLEYIKKTTPTDAEQCVEMIKTLLVEKKNTSGGGD